MRDLLLLQRCLTELLYHVVWRSEEIVGLSIWDNSGNRLFISIESAYYVVVFLNWHSLFQLKGSVSEHLMVGVATTTCGCNVRSVNWLYHWRGAQLSIPWFREGTLFVNCCRLWLLSSCRVSPWKRITWTLFRPHFLAYSQSCFTLFPMALHSFDCETVAMIGKLLAFSPNRMKFEGVKKWWTNLWKLVSPLVEKKMIIGIDVFKNCVARKNWVSHSVVCDQNSRNKLELG